MHSGGNLHKVRPKPARAIPLKYAALFSDQYSHFRERKEPALEYNVDDEDEVDNSVGDVTSYAMVVFFDVERETQGNDKLLNEHTREQQKIQL